MPESSPEELDVNAANAADTASQDTTDVKDTSAESSSAEPKGETDLLSAVKAALKPAEQPPGSKTEGSDAAKAPDAALDKDADKGSETDDLTEEELNRLKPKTRKRIENLVAKVHERDGRIAELEPKASQFEKMTRFIGDANLSIPEVNDGFEVMRLLKNQPEEAYKRLRPIMDQLELIVGEKLPDDLQQAVAQGQITEAHARELQRTRSREAQSQAELQRRSQKDDLENRQRDLQEKQTQVHSTIADWEKAQASSDPEWKLKQPRLNEIVQLETLRREKANPDFIWTPDEALKFAAEAMKRVNAEFAQFKPKPKAVNPITDVASTRSEAKPKSALEAARMALAQAG